MDDDVLSQLKTRSEFRKSTGLVKMNTGEIEKRNFILDTEWVSPEDSGPSEGEDGAQETLDFYGNDGDDEEEEDEEESEDEADGEAENEDPEDEQESEIEPPLSLPSKRKRLPENLKKVAAPPKKRVAFDLQKPVNGNGPLSKRAPPNPNIKKSTVASRKRR